MNAKEERQFEKIGTFRDAYFDSLRGQEFEPEELLAHALLGSLLTSNDITSPEGSRESDWEAEGGAEYGLTRGQRVTIYKQMDRLLRSDPLMQNAHRIFNIHICGKGPWVKLHDLDGEKHPLTDKLENLIPDFPAEARFIISNTLKFGELYVVHLPITGNPLGRPAYEILSPGRCLKIHTKSPKVLRPKITAYNFPILKKEKTELGAGIIPREAVTFFRIYEDLNDGLHGLSIYYVASKELTRYTDWLNSRQLRAKADSIFLILRQMTGKTAGKKTDLPERPSVITTNRAKEDWKTIEAGGNARAASADGYEFRIRVAQGLGLPEHEVTGNAQYAAQMGRSYPTLIYEYFQSVFTMPLKQFVATTLGIPTREILIVWPYVDTQERAARVTEVMQLADKRIISRAELHRRLEYDHDMIELELKAELAEQAAMIAPTVPLGMGLTPVAPTPVLPPVGEAPVAPPGGEIPLEEGGPVIESSLPGASVLPFETKEIEGTPNVLGIDYGYSHNGAVLLAESGNHVLNVLGEIRLRRTSLQGEQSWQSTLESLQEKYPGLEAADVGSDLPELTALLDKIGFDTHKHKIAQEETIAKMKELSDGGWMFVIHPRCTRLLNELMPEQADIEAQGHIGVTNDFFDAFRYLIEGIHNQINIGENNNDQRS